MFGTVKPRPCALPAEDRDAYRKLYCGTCRGLGEYAFAVRALVSYDVVLLSAVIGGAQAAAPCTDTCRCPLNPLVHKPIVATDDPAMRAGAAVQLLLADAWLEDHAQDGTPAVGLLRPLLPVERALATLAELGFDSAPLKAITERQRAVETPGAGPEEAAEPTRDLVGHILGSALDLPGTDPALQTPSARSALVRLGRALGAVIYLVDALDDLAKDVASGAFNPNKDAEGRADQGRVERSIAVLQEAVATLEEGVLSFPWRRNEHLLRHTIGEQLPKRVNAAIRAGRAAIVPPAPPPPPQPWGIWLSGRLLAFAADDELISPEGGQRRRRKPPEDDQSDAKSSCCDYCECCSCDGECCNCCEGCGGHHHCAACECGSCECGACECGACDCCGGCDCCSGCSCG